ncbi:hypothetical protein HYS00_02580 [Candidatus Microgenomates bacterium]|nr:hypothetical protein [Candidatus Microgenomates bacterium]
MVNVVFKSKVAFLLLSLAILIVFWYVRIQALGIHQTPETYLFGFTYALIALIGGINGLWISRVWGGFRSVMGKGIIFLSLALLGLWLGQTIWSIYNLQGLEVPYPSLADIGYFSIIPLCALSIFFFARASGARFSLRQSKGKLVSVAIPIAIALIYYFTLVRNLQPDASPIKTFFNYGYPLGEAFTISLAFVSFELSRQSLGGRMKLRILYLMFALIFHFVTECIFLYTQAAGTYQNAGFVDLMYAISFTILSLGLIYLRNYE